MILSCDECGGSYNAARTVDHCACVACDNCSAELPPETMHEDERRGLLCASCCDLLGIESEAEPHRPPATVRERRHAARTLAERATGDPSA